jgi:hypothetical protein
VVVESTSGFVPILDVKCARWCERPRFAPTAMQNPFGVAVGLRTSVKIRSHAATPDNDLTSENDVMTRNRSGTSFPHSAFSVSNEWRCNIFKSLDLQKDMEAVGLDGKHVGIVDHLERLPTASY